MQLETYRIVLTLAIITGLFVGITAAVTLSNSTPTTGTVPVGVDGGPTVNVVGSNTLDLSNPQDGNTVTINSTVGNFSAYSSGDTELSVYPGVNMTGTWTNVTGVTAGFTWIELYPDDKPRVDTRGDVNALSIYETRATDDGQADFYYSGTDGGLVTIKYYNAAPNTQIAATDAQSNSVLDVAISDSNGNITFDLPASSHSVELETSDGAPELTNPSPTGQITESPEYLEIGVADPDFPDDVVNVNISFEGTQVYSESVTQNKTVNTNNFTANQLGKTYNWSVTATDEYGQTTTKNYSFEPPNSLYIHSEQRPSKLVDNVSVNATITGSGETVDLTTVSNGVVNMSGLPADESYVFTLLAPDYHPREVYVEDLFTQQVVFMLNKSVAYTENQITITDRTGEFGEGTVIFVDRVINTSVVGNLSDNGPQWVGIGGDRLGAGGFYAVDLQENARYRFRVLSEESGAERVLSEYTAKASGQIDLQIGSIRYAIGDENTYEWDVSHFNNSGTHEIRFAYNDHENLTSNVSVEILTRENRTLVGSQDFTTGPYGEIIFTKTVSQSEWDNNTYVVEWSAERDGDVISGSRLVGGKATLSLPLADVWKSIAYGASILVLAFLVGAGAGVAPALITIGMASGFAVYIGLAPASLGFGSTILVVALGAIYMINKQP